MTYDEMRQAIAKKVEDWDLEKLIEFAADRVYQDLELLNDKEMEQEYREVFLNSMD